MNKRNGKYLLLEEGGRGRREGEKRWCRGAGGGKYGWSILYTCTKIEQ
jgi:hypothetical protein